LMLIVLGVAELARNATIDAASNDFAYLRVHLVNESPLPLRPDPTRDPYISLTTREEALGKLESGEAQEVYVLEREYVQTGSVERIARAGRVTPETIERNRFQQGQLEAFLRRSLTDRERISPAAAARIVAPVKVHETRLEPEPGDEVERLARGILPSAFSVLFVLTVFATSGYLLQSVTEEKESRVIEIVLSSVPPLPLMAGKLVGMGAAGLTQVAVWVVAAVVATPLIGDQLGLSNLSFSVDALALPLVYFILGYLAYGSIFGAVGALAPGTREAGQIAAFFGLFAFVPLWFTSLVVYDPGSPIIAALALVPMTAPAAMLQLLAFAPERAWPLVPLSLSILAAFAALAIVVSARIFRATVLLYGVRPGLRQIAAAVMART
ncbi:MAG: ABC transporter permease, partial [Chloroflexota bacterium]|nr:ABC transporter permease [Chloroflexota bacterium]